MFFEVTLMQLLNLFLGFPTYALTVTLMSLLVFTGVGALLSGRRFAAHRASAVLLLGLIAGLTVFYLFGLTPLTDSLLGLPLGGPRADIVRRPGATGDVPGHVHAHRLALGLPPDRRADVSTWRGDGP